MGNWELLFLVICAGFLKGCACHGDTNTVPSTLFSCPEYSLRMPYQCGSTEGGCDYAVKWEDSGRNVNVTLSARLASKDGWSAVGFAASRTAPPLALVLCSCNGNVSSVQLTHSVNHSLVPFQQNPMGLKLIETLYQDKALTCSFSLSKDMRSFGEPLGSRTWFVVLASGTFASNSTFASPVNRSECACNLTSCLDCCQSNISFRRLLMKLHAAVMMMVFMVFVPAAAMVARYYKPVLPGSWIKVHMSMMVVGVAGMLAGLGLILGHTAGKITVGTHQYVGLVCIGLAMLQPVYGFLRPPLGVSSKRKVFNVVHRLGAAFILILGTFNLFSGVFQLHSEAIGLMAGTLGVHLIVSLVTAILLEFLSRPVSSDSHAGYHKMKKLGDENSSSEEEVFVKEDDLKRISKSNSHIHENNNNACAKELTILVTYLFLTFSLSGLASGMVYYN